MVSNYIKRGNFMKKILNVDGMTCDHCVSTIKQAVENLVGVFNVEVDIEKKQVIVEMEESTEKIKDLVEIITEVGFKVRI